MSKKTLKRLLAMTLTVLTVLAFAVPAFAAVANTNPPKGEDNSGAKQNGEATDYTITIQPNEATTQDVNNRYYAYQIFKGTVDTDTQGTLTGPTSGNNYPTGTASNALGSIDWGNGVDAAALVTALLAADATKLTKKAELKAALVTAGVKFDGDYTIASDNATAGKALDSQEVAQAVANWLGGTGSVDAKAFADIAIGHVTNWYGPSTWVEGSSNYQINQVPAGYYLIEDTYAEGSTADGKASSEFMMTVVGNVTVYTKSDVPKSGKGILQPGQSVAGNDTTGQTDENGTVKGETNSIGDEIKFQLHGTLPENYAEYVKYQYAFKDTLSAGLTYTGNLHVYAKAPNGDIYEIDPEASSDAADGYYTDPANMETFKGEGATFTVGFRDLTKVTQGKKVWDHTDGKVTEGKDDLPTPGITKDWEFYVEYTAELNENAKVGNNAPGTDDGDGKTTPPADNDRNVNSSHLEYSNNPEDGGDGTGKTTEDKVYEFTFEIDAKKEGVEDDATGLAGATFSLKKTENSVTYYAVYKKSGDTYTVVDWITESQLGALKTANGGENFDWAAGFDETKMNAATTAGQFEAGTYYVGFTSGNTPDHVGEMNVKGLGNGTYTLTEEKTPDGYTTMDPVNFQITAELTTTQDSVNTLTGTVTQTRQDATAGTADVGAGTIPLTLVNQKTKLPSTGGIGTTLFYVGGALLLLGAAAGLFLMNRKEKENA